MIIKYYLTPPQVEGKLYLFYLHLSGMLSEIDEVGSVKHFHNSTMLNSGRSCSSGEGAMRGQILSHWGFPPIPNTWLFSWVEHEEN